jgi:hypothetical protein
MFWVSLDGHTLNVTEADDTPIYNKANSALHRLKFHNGQRYSVIVDTSIGSVGDAYWLRAEMNTACLTVLPDDFSNTTYAIVRYVNEDGTGASTSDPTTSDWTDVVSGEACTDIDTSSLTPIIAKDAPTTVVKRGMFSTGLVVGLDSSGNIDVEFEVNSTTFSDLVYQPILHTLAAGGIVNSSNVASVTYDTVGAVDLVINNLDTAIDHPYHCESEDVQMFPRDIWLTRLLSSARHDFLDRRRGIWQHHTGGSRVDHLQHHQPDPARHSHYSGWHMGCASVHCGQPRSVV